MGCKASVSDEKKNPDVFSRNSEITEIIQLVLNEPVTENEMTDVLINFWYEYDNLVLQDEDICSFDVLSMYMLDCVFKRNGPTLSSVSRSLYCYIKLTDQCTKGHKNSVYKRFVKNLRKFTNFSSAEGEEILLKALINSLLDGNFGLSIFLLKFGLVNFPTEANKKSKRLVQKLVDRFNDILRYTNENEQAEDMPLSIKLHEVLNLMRLTDIKPRRFLMTFFLTIVISEFQLHKKIVPDDYKNTMELALVHKLFSTYQVFETTTEPRLKFKDIEIFTLKILNRLLNPDFGKSLLEFAINIHCHFFGAFNPRSLKDIARSTIRENLQSSMTFPEQVKLFDIPDDLKDYLLYHCEGIFDLLKVSQTTNNYQMIARFLLDGNVLEDLED